MAKFAFFDRDTGALKMRIECPFEDWPLQVDAYPQWELLALPDDLNGAEILALPKTHIAQLGADDFWHLVPIVGAEPTT